MKTVTLLQGEPFVIPCSISTIATPSHIDWYQNGTLINDKKVRLMHCLSSFGATFFHDYMCVWKEYNAYREILLYYVI